MRMTVSPLLTKGATLDYRKIQGLEHDPVIMGNYLQSDLFKDVASRTYPGGAVGIYRTMFFNKVGTPSVKVKLLVTNPTNRPHCY